MTASSNVSTVEADVGSRCDGLKAVVKEEKDGVWNGSERETGSGSEAVDAEDEDDSGSENSELVRRC